MAVKQENYVTKEGLEGLKQELETLTKVERPDVINAIKEARALGDLSENAEYHAAKERQGQVETRIKELEYLIEHSIIIEEGKSTKVRVGSTVEIKYIDDDEIEEYKIVGSTEADPFENKISNDSPIARALIGKKAGDKVEVESPNGSFTLKIVKVA